MASSTVLPSHLSAFDHLFLVFQPQEGQRAGMRDERKEESKEESNMYQHISLMCTCMNVSLRYMYMRNCMCVHMCVCVLASAR